jgi:argininosuccinate lyase
LLPYPFTNRDAFSLAWFSAYAESLIDDITMLNAALTVVDQNPLGSAAGYGSSFPIDRTFTTKELGRNPEIQCRCGANESRKIRKSWLLP